MRWFLGRSGFVALCATVVFLLFANASQATDFTRNVPGTGLRLPDEYPQAGGVAIVMVGSNGNAYYQFSNPAGAFRGFQYNGSPSQFRGNPFTINNPISLDCGFSDCATYFGGSISNIYIRFSAYDGDTQVGGFDEDDISLRINGFTVGNWSDITTEITNNSGTTSGGFVQGFGNNTFNTGWFSSSNPALLANILSTGQTSSQVFDSDPNDNYWDFRRGNSLSNQSIVTVAPGYTIEKSANTTTFSAVNQTVTYTYIVTNIGSVPIRQLSVSDDKIASVSCDKSTIQDTNSGGTADFATCTATYQITQEDFDAGVVTNVASALGVPDFGNLGVLTDTLSIAGPTASPDLFVEKSTTLSAFGAAGSTVPYSFLIRNDGDVTLSNFTVTDSLIPGLVCNVPDLAPTEDFTCSGNYTVTQPDVDRFAANAADTLDNTVTVSADTPRDGRLTETDDVSLPGPTANLDLELTKTALETTYDAEGDIINFQIVLRNAGNVTFPAAPAVSDPQAGTVTCPAGPVAPGNSVTCTASYTIQQGDIDRGSFENTASATVTVGGQSDTETDSVTVNAIRSVGLTLDKTLDAGSPSQFSATGVGLEYDYLLTNTGNVALENIAVADDQIGVTCPAPTLAPGATMTCSSAVYATTQGNINQGGVTNIASATATEAGPTAAAVTSNTDTVTVPAVQSPAIELTKTAPTVLPGDFTAGRVVTYTFAVRNTGNVRIAGNIGVSEVTITDDKIGTFTCFPTPLTIGQTQTCTADYTLTNDDINAGFVVNTATAAAGTTVSPQVSATIAPTFTPAISLLKSTSTASVDATTDTITYSFLITNTGDSRITTPIQINDPLLTTAASCPQPPDFDPGDSFTCTGERSGITQPELDAGSVDNAATASFAFTNGGVTATVTSNESSVSVPVTANPSVTLSKSGPATFSSFDEELTYEFEVSNTGNVTLRTATVTDPLIPGLNCVLTDIAPGTSQSCTGTYDVTQPNVDDETFTNTATVQAQPAQGAQQTDTSGFTSNLAVGAGTKTATLDKQASISSFAQIGDQITYVMEVENTGTQTLSALAVSDVLDPAFSCVIPTLAPGAIDRSCQFQYTISQDDIDAGQVDNTATLSSAEIATQTDSVTVTGPARTASYTFDKQAPAGFTAALQPVEFAFVVENTGTVTLSNIQITDPFFGAPVSCTIPTLEPGQTDRSCTATYVTTQNDVDTGSITNTANVTVDAPAGVTDPADQSDTVIIQGPTENAAVVITKASTDGAYTSATDSEIYTFSVQNTGNVTLTGLTVTDTDLGFTCVLDDLEPLGIATTCANGTPALSETKTFDQTDVDQGSYTNTATVTGQSAVNATPVSDSDTVTVQGPGQVPALEIEKTTSLTGDFDTLGQQVSYSYRVFNRGNITLTAQISVTDDKIATVSCPVPPASGIAPGAFIDCTATATITQPDLDAGFLENTATASVTQPVIPMGPGGPTSVTVTSPTDTVRIEADQQPALRIEKRVKTGSAASYSAIGDLVTFEYVVTNIGNVTTTSDITVSDDKIPGILTCSTTPLAPLSSVTCEQVYIADQPALDDGSVTNIAAASTVFDGATVTSANDSVTINAVQNPSLAVEKTFTGTDNPGNFDEGDLLSYSIVVTNNGNVTIDGPITFQDSLVDFPSGFTCPPLALDMLPPGNTYTCTSTHNVTRNDLDLGSSTNVVSASGSFNGSPVTSPSDNAVYPVSASPSLSLLKEALPVPGGLSMVGDTVTYRYTVENTGNVGLIGEIQVVDDKLGTLTCKPPAGGGVPTLATSGPNSVVECLFPYLLTQDDVDAGFVTNNATAQTTYASLGASPTNVVSPNADATVTITETPELTVLKELVTALPNGAAAEQDLTYRITATNSGNQTLRGVTIADPLIDSLSCTVTPGGAAAPANVTLDPNAALVCTGTYRVTQDDVDAQTLVNTANATATDPQGETVGGSDSTTADIEAPNTAMEVIKSTLRPVGPDSDFSSAGEEIEFAVSVRNTGNITLQTATVTDARTVVPASCTVGPLAPGAVDDTCRFVYTVTQDDVDVINTSGGQTFGGFINVASVTATPVNPALDDITETGEVFVRGPEREPALRLVKTADLSEITQAGQTVNYTFGIFNTGNITLTDVPEIDDDKIGTFACAPFPTGGLLPGDEYSCTQPYTVTQEDMDNGGVTNIATATSPQVAPAPEQTATLTLPITGTPSFSIVKTPSITQNAQAGDTISYSYVVTNTGNFTLSNVTLVDDHTSASGTVQLPFDSETLTGDINTIGTSPDGAGPGVWGTLAPGDEITFIATYEVTQRDVDEEVTLTNTVAATASAPAGLPDPSGTDNASVAVIPKAPGLAVSKTVDTSNITSPAVVGQQVPFTITVENTGNQTLTTPALTDVLLDAQGQPLALASGPTLASGDTDGDTLLDVGETWTYDARFDLTQDAIDAGGFGNTVTVNTVDPQGVPVNGSDSSTDVVLNDMPVIGLVKTATIDDGGDGSLDENDVITYRYVVSNIGNVTVWDVNVTETGFAGEGITPTPVLTEGGVALGGNAAVLDLPVGSGTMTFTATYSITQADLDAGRISNQATAEGISPSGDPAQDVSDDNTNQPGANDPTVTDLATTAAMVVEKRADTSGLQSPAMVGDPVSFTITVANTGNLTLTAPALTDTLLDGDGLALTLDAGPSPTGGDANGNNTLDVGETWVYSARFDLTQQAIDAEGISNSVRAEARAPDGSTVRDTSDDDAGASDGSGDGDPANDPTVVPVAGAPEFNVLKSAVLNDGGDGVADAGDTITYTYTVTNTGTQTIIDIVINETGFGGTGDAPVPAYQSGGSALGGSTALIDLPVGTTPIVYTATYTLQQADVDAGGVSNQVTVSGRDTDGNPVIDLSDPTDPNGDAPTVMPLVRMPAIQTVKLATPRLSNPVQEGDAIDYQITVANIGNVTLTQPALVDQLTDAAGAPLTLTSGPTLEGGDTNGNGQLDVDETWIYGARFVLTQPAIDAGGVSNTATGSGRDPEGNPVSDVSDDGSTNPADSDPTVTPITRTPAIGLVKTSTLDLGSDGIATEGDRITYRYTVTNLGNVTVFDIAVTETVFTGTGTPPAPSLISGGASIGAGAAPDLPVGTTPMVFEATYTLTQPDVDAGQISNEALASGTDPDGATVSDASDDATPGQGANDPTVETLPGAPGLKVVKTAITTGLADPVVEGNQITFVITAENTGNVSLSNVTLSDTFQRRDGTLLSLSPSLSSGDGGTAGLLEVDETWEYRATYALTQADIDAGGVSNSAEVSTTAPGGTPVRDTSDNGVPGDGNTDDDPTTVNIAGAPALTMVKQLGAGAPVPFTQEGQLIPFEFVVTNTGSVTLTAPITISDPLIDAQGLGGVTCPAPPVAPGGSITCMGSYAVQQEDVDRGSFENSATASVTQPVVPANPGDPTSQTLTSDPSGVTVAATQTPSLIATKAIAPGSATSFAAVGDQISYLFTVTNTGNVTLSEPITIDDDQIGTGLACGPGPLAPGGMVSCTHVWSAEQDDLNLGSVTNIATAQTVVDGTPFVSDPVSASAPAVQTKSLGMVKTLTGAVPDQFDIGTVLSYDFVVTNTGNVTVDGPIAINDTLATDAACPPLTNGVLLPGQDVTCTGTYSLRQGDLELGSTTNVATATGTIDGAPITSPSDSALYPVGAAPAISLSKDSVPADVTFAAVDDVITYSFTLSNTSLVGLTENILITDNRIGAPFVCYDAATDGVFGVGAVHTCTADYLVTQEDLDEGFVTNEAIANTVFAPGTPSEIDVLSPAATKTVDAVTDPALTLEKVLVSPPAAAEAGDLLTYRLTATNTGNQTLSAVSITDVMLPNLSCTVGGAAAGSNVVLAPTEALICEGTYEVMQDDFDAQELINDATAMGQSPQGENITDDAQIPAPLAAAQPALEVVKTLEPVVPANQPAFEREGDVIQFRLTARNTGNVTLNNVMLEDERTTTPARCSVGSLLPDAENGSCLVSYRVTQEDVDALNGGAPGFGGFLNRATGTAVANTPTGETVDDTAELFVRGPDRAPAFSLEKTADVSQVTAAGDVITYTYVVTNSGNVTLTAQPQVTDDKIANVNCAPIPGGGLAPGDTLRCSATYEVLIEDIDAGSITNIARVSSAEVPLPAVPGDETDSATVAALANPQLLLIKAADITSDLTAGDDVTYTYTVTNAGNITLRNVALDDQHTSAAGTVTLPVAGDRLERDAAPTGDSSDAGANGIWDVLAPGDVAQFTATYTVTQEDIDAGEPISNTATVSATTPGSPAPISVSTTRTVTPEPGDPALEVIKTVDLSAASTPPVAGETLTYTITVENTGNLSVENLVLEDTLRRLDGTVIALSNPPVLTGGDAGQIDVLEVDELWTYTASHILTQEDIDAGGLSNQVVARGVTPGGTPVEDTSDDNVTGNGPDSPTVTTIAPSPGIEGEKTLLSSAPTVGARLEYEIIIRNTGNVSLQGVAVAEDRLTRLDGTVLALDAAPTFAGSSLGSPAGILLPSEQARYRAFYTLQQLDIDAGGVNNSATVSGTPPDGAPITDVTDNGIDTDGNTTDDPTVFTILRTPELDLTKRLSPLSPVTFNTEGQELTYDFVVTNTGNVTLIDPIVISDPRLTGAGGSVTCQPLPFGGLQPDAELSCTGTYAVSQLDIDTGQIVNTATASSGVTTSDPATVTTLAQQEPALSLVKTPQSVPAASFVTGAQITYTYLTTNTGNTTISTPITVSDNLIAPADITCEAFPTAGIAPGGTYTCTGVYSVTATDVDLGSVTNLASATDGTTTSPLTSATIPDQTVPALSIVKSVPDGTTFTELGDVLTYSFVVTNSGTRAFAQSVSVMDTLIGPIDCFVPTTEDPDLIAGESVTCGGTYTITQADLDRGEVLNEAFAQTTFGVDNMMVASPPSAVTVTAALMPQIELAKTAATLPIAGPGQTLTYTLTATNTGNQTLRNVVIRDDMLADFECSQDILERDATLSCTGTAMVTQADIDAGNITNTADVSGITPQGDAVTATRTLVIDTPVAAPAVTLQKTATPTPFGAPGTTLTYLFEVRNTGNVTLRDLVVTDQMDAAYRCEIATLAPGSIDNGCTFERLITQADQDAGMITNTAAVTGTAPGDVTVGDQDTLQTAGPTVEGALEATKTVAQGGTTVGSTVSFNLTVANTGNTTLRNIAITDEMTDLGGREITLTTPFVLVAASDTGGDGALSVGEIWTYTATRILTQSDVLAGGLSNQVTAVGRSPSGRPVIDVSDNGIDTDGNTTNDPTVFLATAPAVPVLDVVKTVASAGFAVGDTVTFTITAQNVGPVAIQQLAVSDTMTRLDGSPVAVDVTPVSVPNVLNVDAAAIWQINHVLTPEDVAAGGLRNTATVSGIGPFGGPVSDTSDNGDDTDGNSTDDPTVFIIESTPPDYEILKTVEAVGTLAGEEATFLVEVTNTGGQVLSGLSLTDTLTDINGENPRTLALTYVGTNGTAGSVEGTLNPGETATYRATTTLTQSDIDVGGLSNTVLGSAQAPGGTPIERRSDNTGDGGDDPTIAEIEALPSFEVVKVAGEPELLFPTVERITFTISVTNTGNVTHTDVVVTDDLAAFLAPAVLLSDVYPVVAQAEGFGEDGTVNAAYDGVADTNLLNAGATLAPGEVGTITVTLVYSNATGQPGAPNTAAAVSTQLEDPTLGEVTVQSSDTDGDGIPDRLESATADRDGDGIPDREDYDPTGVFYCEDDGRLLRGGQISVSGNGFTQTGTGTNGPITVVRDGSQGSYQFFATAAGTYRIGITYPATTRPSTTRTSRGDLDLTTLLPSNPGVIGAGPAGDTGLLTDSSADANPFYTSFTVQAGDPIAINNNIPVRDCDRITDVNATKTADRRTAVFGETVNFVLSFSNQSDVTLTNGRIVDLLPSGLIYTPGSARLAGEAIEPVMDGRRLEWRRDLAAGETLEVRIAARVVRTGRFGTLTNRTFLENRFGRTVSNIAEADVRIDPEHVFDCSDVIGRVFHDRNGNGYQDGPGTLSEPIIEDSYQGDGKFGKLSDVPKREDRTEAGLAGVRLVTPDGILITTDEFGRYSLPCAALPRNIGSNFMLKLDTRTLPPGFRVTTENPRVVRLTAGKFAKMNFGVQQGRIVDIDLTATAFDSGTATPKAGLSGAVDGLIEQVKDDDPLLRLTYALSAGETPALARARLRAIEDLIQSRWRGRGSGTLEIVKTIAKTR